MDVNKNSYIFTFSAILVIVVGATLAIAAESLKPMQQENVRIEKMQSILTTVGIPAEKKEAQNIFDKYITDQMILDDKGNVVQPEGFTAFDVDVLNEFKSMPSEKRNYPLFVFEDENGDKKYIVPMAGKGLWGPVWGFVSFGPDMNTVTGAVFDHKSETPGLGAEIREQWFQQKFVGKQIFDESGEFVSVEVLKGGVVTNSNHAVDGISGGTITSKGVEEMIERTLNVYVPYFKKG